MATNAYFPRMNTTKVAKLLGIDVELLEPLRKKWA